MDNGTKEIERNVSVFAANLDRLMMKRGKRNAALARDVGVSREMISVWRRGKSLPSDYNSKMLAQALGVAENDLYIEANEKTQPMLPIAQWAKREGIPLNRAKNLFELGVLSGMDDIQMIPASIRAPSDSKHIARMARRPPWITAFSVNLDYLMRVMSMTNHEMAAATGVTYNAVSHWRSGRGYPREDRLPDIAGKLKCSVDTLLSDPPSQRENEWRYRFNHLQDMSESQAA
jgi:transcriptional regulator with XRE-family HTH domain